MFKGLKYNQYCLNAFFALSLLFVLFLHGAIPFLMAPTLGQAISLTGFSESFANGTIFSVYSDHFGYPSDKVSLAMGMPIAVPAGYLIRFGFHASDAYSAIVAAWLSLAFIGSYFFARQLGIGKFGAILAALVWMSFPFTWWHARYSALSVGLSLLPLYLFVAVKLFCFVKESDSDKYLWYFSYFMLCSIALFMDGYSFLMFAVGSSLIFGFTFLYNSSRRRYLIFQVAPIHALSFLAAYALYALYVGKFQYAPSSMDMFRGWGTDLTYFLIPSEGVSWFWDFIEVSVVRSELDHFGDASVWMTTYLLPIVLIGLFSFWKLKGKNHLSVALFSVAFFGIYMSLGPALKFNSVKPENLGPSMPDEFSVISTGNEWIYANVPGFSSTRATYRWSVLGALGFWAASLLYTSSLNRRSYAAMVGIIFPLLIVFNLPNLVEKSREGIKHRQSFFKIDDDLVDPLSDTLSSGERVAFLPYRNDFLVNYLAPRLGIKTYNIGGDKQLFSAREVWPRTMRGFSMASIDSGFHSRILLLLVRGEVDAVVLPYIDLLWAAHLWPNGDVYFDEVEPVIRALEASELVDITRSKHFSVVRLNENSISKLSSNDFDLSTLFGKCESLYPVVVKERSCGLPLILGEGWYQMEAEHIWSTESAELFLPKLDPCENGRCDLAFSVKAFAASSSQPVRILFSSYDAPGEVIADFVIESSSMNVLTLPVEKVHKYSHLKIEVSPAQSPMMLGVSADSRTLGIALYKILLMNN